MTKRKPKEAPAPIVVEHVLVEIEAQGAKNRFRCSCGTVGLFVGCDAFDGDSWARLAHEYHAAQTNYDAPATGLPISSFVLDHDQ